MGGGAFVASPRFGYDERLTQEEILRSGWHAERWVDRHGVSSGPDDVHWGLICHLHSMWFQSTFPGHAGVQRGVIVANRKGTAVAPSAIVEACENSCADWRYRQEHYSPDDPVEQLEFAVAEANELSVRIYDIHPFIDGNTRTTFSLRNLLLVRAELYGLETADHQKLADAWWNARPGDHGRLDELVLESLIEQDMRREPHNRIL